MNLGGGIGLALGALSILVALAAIATFIALGTQRGRVQNLETARDDLKDANQSLRDEIADNERRHVTKESELQRQLTDALDRGVRQQSAIDTLSGQVETLSAIPLEALAGSMQQALDLLAGHHREAMFGQELQAGMMLDLLHMNGDKRDRQTIAQAMRAQGVEGPDA